MAAKKKTKAKSKRATSMPAAAVEEEAFPRGGGEALSHLEKRQVREQAERDFAKEQLQLGKRRQAQPMGAKKKRKTLKDKFAPLTGDEMLGGEDLSRVAGAVGTGSSMKYVELLSFRRLHVGMKLWGIVQEVSERDVGVSLPHGLRGFIPRTAASDLHATETDSSGRTGPSLRRLYTVGERIAVVVTALEDQYGRSKSSSPMRGKAKGKEKSDVMLQRKRRIQLSACASALNKAVSLSSIGKGMLITACIISEEDHGYEAALGVKSMRSFVPWKHLGIDEAEKDMSNETKLPLGKMVMLQVKAVDLGKKLVTLGRGRGNVSPMKIAVSESLGLALDTLVPGSLVNCTVQSLLSDGLVLSFLTYFTATVDHFHIPDSIPGYNWQKEFPKGTRVKARILYIDNERKRVGVTLKDAYVEDTPVAALPPVGTLYENAKVCRVDEDVGALVQLTNANKEAQTGGPTLVGYCHMSHLADHRVEKVGKAVKVGQRVKVRVIGPRDMDLLANVSMKESIISQNVISLSDCTAGSILECSVLNVQENGVTVQVTEGVRAFAPRLQLADVFLTRPETRFAKGAKVKARVLENDPIAKRLIVTFKKSLLSSKLPVLSSYEEAEVGVRTHGYVFKVEDNGLSVRFYNKVRAWIPLTEISAHQRKTRENFEQGQTVKCRVIRVNVQRRKMTCSLLSSEQAVRMCKRAVEGVSVGSIVSGMVSSKTARHLAIDVVKDVSTSETCRALLDPAQLSDDEQLCSKLFDALQPGDTLDELLVLDVDESRGLVRVSAKRMLIECSKRGAIPKSIGELKPGQVYGGFVSSVRPSLVFVHFLNRLAGAVPVQYLADEFVEDASLVFQVGRSIRAKLVAMPAEEERKVTLSLRPSESDTDASEWLRSHLKDAQFLEVLQKRNQSSSEDGELLGDKGPLAVGEVLSVEVTDIKDYGIICLIHKRQDLVGFVPHYHVSPKIPCVGDTGEAVVLDVNEAEGIVDVSFRKELIAAAKKPHPDIMSNKKRKSLSVNSKTSAMVQLVKENYMVLTLPIFGHQFVLAATRSFNYMIEGVHEKFEAGQHVKVVITAEPNEAWPHSYLVSIEDSSPRNAMNGEQRESRSVNKSTAKALVGQVLSGRVLSRTGLEMVVDLGGGVTGKVHVSELPMVENGDSPVLAFSEGQEVTCRVQRIVLEGQHTWVGILTMRPSQLHEKPKQPQEGEELPRYTIDVLKTGDMVTGYVESVSAEGVWVSLSPKLRGRVHPLDTSDSSEEVEALEDRFHSGECVKCRVLRVDMQKHAVDLSLRAADDKSWSNWTMDAQQSVIPAVGAVLCGRVAPIGKDLNGLSVQLSAHSFGRVHVTDLADRWPAHAIQRFQPGDMVKCVVLSVSSRSNKLQIDLSMRPSRGGCGGLLAQKASREEEREAELPLVEEISDREDLQPGQLVYGYVKHCSQKGCFVALGRNIDAMVGVSKLADKYMNKPEVAFPRGCRVYGKVLEIKADGKISLSLRDSDVFGKDKEGSRFKGLAQLAEGEVIRGTVLRVVDFGVFIAVDKTKATGLCHISQCVDEFLKDKQKLHSLYRKGQSVVAKVIEVDVKEGKLALGLKRSLFTEEELAQFVDEEDNDLEDPGDELMLDNEDEDSQHDLEMEEDIHGHQEVREPQQLDEEEDEDEPLQVVPMEEEKDVNDLQNGKAEGETLDATLDFGFDDHDAGEDDHDDGDDMVEEEGARSSRTKLKRQKQREKEAKEKAIVQREARIQSGEGDPESVDEYEKLCMASPDSSFIWIKYMAFLLSLSEVEQARRVAERALQTIGFREEGEKLNVWVALLNLENMHGTPPDEAVLAVFQRALTLTDPKKLHIALLGIYERGEQYDAATELWKSACRRFRTSCKIWLKQVRLMLIQKKGEQARRSVERGLEALPKRKHTKFVSQVGLLEYKIGSPERARSLFEGLVANFPKRTDLWSVYLDQEIKHGDQGVIRALFQRATNLDLSTRKMKFFFKRYLQYEQEHGDDTSVAAVKEAAMNFANERMNH